MDYNKMKKAELIAEIDELVTSLKAMSEDVRLKDDKINNLNKDKEDLNDTINNCNDSLSLHEQIVAQLSDENNTFKKNAEGANATIKNLQSSLTMYEEEIGKLNKRCIRIAVWAILASAIAIASTIMCWF